MTLAERIEKFNNLMGDTVPPEVKKDLLDKGFFTAPASTKYHGNYEGGLFDHSYMVARYLKKLTEEEIMCIRYHMGAFCDKSEWNDYTRAVHKYTNVLWTHQADMLASHVEGV